MLHRGAFQVWQDVTKTGNEKWDHFPRVPCVRSLLPVPGQFGTTTNNASFGSQTCPHSFAFPD